MNGDGGDDLLTVAAARRVLGLASGEDLRDAARWVVTRRGEHAASLDALARLEPPTRSDAVELFDQMCADLGVARPGRAEAVWTVLRATLWDVATRVVPVRAGVREVVAMITTLELPSRRWAGDAHDLGEFVSLHYGIDELHARPGKVTFEGLSGGEAIAAAEARLVEAAAAWVAAHGRRYGDADQVCARGVLLSPENTVLLTEVTGSHGSLWVTPGGRRERNETTTEALARELREELGLTSCEPEAEMWIRRAPVRLGDREAIEREHFFLVRVPAFEPRPDSPESGERERLVRFAWWSVEEIVRSDAAFAPRELGALLTALLRDGPPPAPVATGA